MHVNHRFKVGLEGPYMDKMWAKFQYDLMIETIYSMSPSLMIFK